MAGRAARSALCPCPVPLSAAGSPRWSAWWSSWGDPRELAQAAAEAAGDTHVTWLEPSARRPGPPPATPHPRQAPFLHPGPAGLHPLSGASPHASRRRRRRAVSVPRATRSARPLRSSPRVLAVTPRRASVAPLPPLGSEGGPGLRGGRCGPRSAFPQALLTNRKSVSSVCQLFSSFRVTGGSCPAADPSLAEAGVLAARVILMKLICQGKRQLVSSRTLSLRVARPRLCHRGTKRGVPDISSV